MIEHCQHDSSLMFVFLDIVDLHEMKSIGWMLWPLFAVNTGMWSFCSLDYDEHLKGWDAESPSLLSRVKSFISHHSEEKLSINITKSRAEGDSKSFASIDQVQLITHLTYFGYCFNPVSFYYIYKNDPNEINSRSISGREVDFIITEVSNTPWIEQHSYLLHEDIEKTKIIRDHEKKTFQGIWDKNFHVSPFMEMDYKYDFTFSTLSDNIWVKSKLLKKESNEIWFTASFDLKRIDFTPLNILYVLTFYPIQTRLIQVYIHIEAFKLWWKGIPTFSHPNNPTINFGFGITDKLLLKIYLSINSCIDYVKLMFSSLRINRKLHDQ